MNYEKFKRSDRPDRFHSQFDITVNDFLSVVGEKFSMITKGLTQKGFRFL